MRPMQLKSSAEQVAARLRSELAGGKMRGFMPGILRLEAELGVNRKTIESALRQLEREGLLEAQGAGKRRKINASIDALGGVSLRVAILLSEQIDLKLDYMVELRHELMEQGHTVFHPANSTKDLGMDLKRIARMVERTEADAWVVAAGSQEVLGWFANRGIPTFALFGRRGGLPLAAVGPDKRTTLAEAVRKLTALGHRRIVLMARPRRRLPQPGAPEQAFLNELAAQGIPVSDYNMPNWEDTVDGFLERLDSLFRYTPPTAMLIDEAPPFIAAQQFLARRAIRVPEDVSLVCTDYDIAFEWCRPAISHIRWDSRPVVQRVLRWVANVSRGKTDLRQSLTPAKFVDGGTIGPVKDRN